MRVEEICTREVVCVSSGDTIVAAAKRMRKYHVGAVVVIEERAGRRVPVGIVTDRDLVVSILAQEVERPESILVRDVMGRDLVIARADEEVAEIGKRLWSRGIRRLPVVDDEGSLVGVVSYDDLLRWTSSELENLTRLLPRQREREKANRS